MSYFSEKSILFPRHDWICKSFVLLSRNVKAFVFVVALSVAYVFLGLLFAAIGYCSAFESPAFYPLMPNKCTAYSLRYIELISEKDTEVC
jgi:hypothetical protein